MDEASLKVGYPTADKDEALSVAYTQLACHVQQPCSVSFGYRDGAHGNRSDIIAFIITFIYHLSKGLRVCDTSREFSTQPPQGVNDPNFCTTPLASSPDNPHPNS